MSTFSRHFDYFQPADPRSVSACSAPDIYRHGYLAQTFGTHAAVEIISLYGPAADAMFLYFSTDGIPHWQRANSGPVDWSWQTVDYLFVPAMGFVVPQRLWRPFSNKLLPSLVHNRTLFPPVFFRRRDYEGVGISLEDAKSDRHECLRGHDQHVQFGGKTSTSLRILWLGYEEHTRQIQLKDQSAKTKPITLGRWAKRIAAANPTSIVDAEYDPLWRIGAGGITPADITLVGVVQTSAGTWQPLLKVSRLVDLS
ncbi:hypothetical protein EW146_g5733 [Bondarzewia mesenterica]|uniref:Uncharacterized protein n=1 Tax=Bondarzewia mesenterica TaxID=1095465 RepID=A0A4S4LQL6_9AGAM|nr:hypothetical protein EW146_g5733 [Bondarzewia mesenterica]